MIGDNDDGNGNRAASPNNDNEASSHTHDGDEREPTVQELWAKIKFLEAQAAETRQPPVTFIATSKKMRKPPPFKGEPEDRDNRTIHVFLDTMDNYLEIDTIESSERSKIHDLVSFLEDDASHEYHHRVKDHDPFASYDAIKEWLIEHYSPNDSINTIHDHFFACFQGEDESFEDYHYRFKEMKNLLDSPLFET